MASRVAVLLFASLPAGVWSCSRIIHNEPGHPVYSARTMDWSFSFDDFLMVIPRGQLMDGGLGENASSATWTSKYGSVISSVNGWLGTKYSSRTGALFDFEKDGASDGINEKGLAAHLLYLEATQYPPDGDGDARAGVTYVRWVRYLLDTCATVGEAIAAMQRVRVADVQASSVPCGEGKSFPLHVAVEDASGDSAIFEFINGSLRTYHGRSRIVMTNDPPLPEQMVNLRRYKGFGGSEHLPGDVTSLDRFVRLSYLMQYVPKAKNADVMLGYVRSVLLNAAVPFGAPDADSPGGTVYPTWWSSSIDLEGRSYHWAWTLNNNVLRVSLRRLDALGHLAEGAPPLALNPRVASLAGDVSDQFRPVRLVKAAGRVALGRARAGRRGTTSP